jgi:hypothetical protein
MDPIEPTDAITPCSPVALPDVIPAAGRATATDVRVDTTFEPTPCYLDLTCASIAAAAAAQDLRLFVRGPRPARHA